VPHPEDQEETTSVGVTMKGELARVFEDLFFEALRRKQVRSRAEFARFLIVAQLRTMGHDVEDIQKWGGPRDRSEADETESPGELVAVTVN
jgi:hypothetical protein